MSTSTYPLQLVAAILERGDDALSYGWSGGRYSDANWVVDVLLGELGYKVRVTEDGDVELWPQNPEPGDGPITAGHYRSQLAMIDKMIAAAPTTSGPFMPAETLGSRRMDGEH